MFNLDMTAWSLMLVASLIVGVSKTGLPGVGTLAVPLAALALGGPVSVGVLLPMLVFGDIFAIALYHKSVDMRRFLMLLPWALVGVCIGYVINKYVINSETAVNRFIGISVLGLLLLNLVRKELPSLDRKIPRNWVFAAFFGLLAGIITMMANAAGPVMMIYLLAMDFDKNKFIGTGAAYFAFVNIFKVPFQVHLGNLDWESFRLSASCYPAVFVGALIGIWAFKRIRHESFIAVAEVFTALAACKLAISKLTGLSSLAEFGVAAAITVFIVTVVAVYHRCLRRRPPVETPGLPLDP